MTDDEIDIFFAELSLHGLGDVFVGSAVETVFTDAVFFVPFHRDGVHVLDFRDGVVEGGVEDGDLDGVGESLLHGFNAGDVAGVVKRA